jgi:hypothetical protein
VLFVGRSETDHRGLTDDGDVGPSWAWTRYQVTIDGASHAVITVVLPWRDVEVRITAVRPGGLVRLVEAPAALGARRPADVRRMVSTDGRWSAAATGQASVAIRALLGYDVVSESGSFGRGPDRNLVDPHAEQPTIAEAAPSDARRVVASVGWAGGSPQPPIEQLAAVVARHLGPGSVEIALGDDEVAVVDLRPGGGRMLEVGRWRAHGPAVRLLRVGRGGASLAGESIGSIDGVVRLDRRGPIALRRSRAGVTVWAERGFRLDPGWARRPLRRIEVRTPDERWSLPRALDEPGVVPAELLRRLRGSTGRQLLELRLRP